MSPSFTLFKLTMLINLLGLFAYLVHDHPMLLAVFILFAISYSVSPSLIDSEAYKMFDKTC